MNNRGQLYTRHRLSTYQLAALALAAQSLQFYAGKSADSLVRKGLIGPLRTTTSRGKMARAAITPEGLAALRDARDGGWRP